MFTMCKISKSFRLDPKTLELIEQQEGDNLTEKFETLVLSRHQKIGQLDAAIARKTDELARLIKALEEKQDIYSKIESITKYLDWAFSNAGLPIERKDKAV